MSKLNQEQENFFDYYILKNIVEPLSPYIYKAGIKPNLLTLLGLITGIIGNYHLYNYQSAYFSIYFLLSQVFDDSDGYIARKYNMSSTFGDYFDHISDFIKISLFFYILFTRYNLIQYKFIIIYFVIHLLLLFTFVGFQETVSKYKEHNTILQINRLFCYGNPEDNIKFFKYFGSGSFIVMCILIANYLYMKRT
tara:strand:- start:1764 stop:2345 length:582 start_codon:yes stop_codon:yes gene_type:complete